MLCKVSWQNSGVYEEMNEELKIENEELIRYKVVRKSIKHLYMEVKEGYVEVRCNRFVSKKFIENFILKHKEIILKKLNKNNYFLGKKVKKEIDFQKITPKIVLPIVDRYSKKMNLFPSKVSFRFNKTRWGSCSYKNSIVFNYYLAKLPIEIIEYIVVHELSHIKHKNHQKEFCKLVEEYMPDYKERIKVLRRYEKEF